MSSIPLIVEKRLEALTLLEHLVLALPVLVRVLEDLAHVALKGFRRGVLATLHLGLDSLEIHGSLDDVKVVRHVVSCWIDGFAEGLDVPRPVGGRGQHAVDEQAAGGEVGFGGDGDVRGGVYAADRVGLLGATDRGFGFARGFLEAGLGELAVGFVHGVDFYGGSAFGFAALVGGCCCCGGGTAIRLVG